MFLKIKKSITFTFTDGKQTLIAQNRIEEIELPQF